MILWREYEEFVKGDRMAKEKYETCKHAERVGQIAVYVKPSCPRLSIVKGNLVSSKVRCRECRSWEKRYAKD